MPQEFSSGIIAFRRAETIKFLLLNYPNGHWGFSKGNMEKGESSRETALREFKEETGLEIEKMFEGFKEMIEFFYRKEGRIIHKDVTFYLGEASEGKVKLTEHDNFAWLGFEDALAKLKFKNDKELLEKAKKFLDNYFHS